MRLRLFSSLTLEWSLDGLLVLRSTWSVRTQGSRLLAAGFNLK